MKVMQEFKEFAVRGNVVDLAVGVIIGATFTAVVNSFVKDILMPPVGYVIGGEEFADYFYALGGGEYETLAAAQEAGAATLNYGMFVNTIIVFLITAIAIFFLVKAINRLRRKKDEGKAPTPTEKSCPYCATTISIKASRCPNCTSELAEQRKAT